MLGRFIDKSDLAVVSLLYVADFDSGIVMMRSLPESL